MTTTTTTNPKPDSRYRRRLPNTAYKRVIGEIPLSLAQRFKELLDEQGMSLGAGVEAAIRAWIVMEEAMKQLGVAGWNDANR